MDGMMSVEEINKLTGRFIGLAIVDRNDINYV